MSCIGVFSRGAMRMRTTTMDSFSNSTTALAGPAGGIASPWDSVECAPECCAQPGWDPKARNRQAVESQSAVSTCCMARPVARRASFDVRVDRPYELKRKEILHARDEYRRGGAQDGAAVLGHSLL